MEHTFSLTDGWSRRLLLALMRRYGLKPYRYPRQRRTTVRAKVPRRFVDEVLWPQYLELSQLLHDYLSEATDRVIALGLQADASEAEETPEPSGNIEAKGSDLNV